jgi:hypothetical protein
MITTYLTILNTIAVIYLILVKNSKYYISVDKDETFWNKTLLGFRIYLMKKTSDYSASSVFGFYIPIKNKRKTELQEEVNRMIAKESPSNRTQKLTAMFSWLKTIAEVKQFEKDYSVVDRVLVENLVRQFNLRLEYPKQIKKQS